MEMTKEEKYSSILPQVMSLVGGEPDDIANMANVCSLLHSTFGFWWTGFYRVEGDVLVLGPFQGPVACTRIPFGKGVCGTAWKRSETVVVPDVEKFPGHIACSSESRSEIVVPVWHRGRITAVLDIDSRELSTFDGTDRMWLEDVCAALSCRIDGNLQSYVGDNVITRYDSFDLGHRRDHVRYVIRQALKLCCRYDVDPDMVYAAAAFHDTGLGGDRRNHHILSAAIVREDTALRRWFTPQQIDAIADAAEDHRASLDHEPRTIYGKLIAEADRQFGPDAVIRRAIQYDSRNNPVMTENEHWERVLDHLRRKYSENGYVKLWIPESDNARMLEELRAIIRDEQRLHDMFLRILEEETEL